jgi:hypothetical protein
MYNQQVITNAVREGARYGIVMTDAAHPITQAMVEQKVRDYASSHLVTFSTVTTNPIPNADRECGPGTFGSSLTVSVTYDYTFLVASIFMPGLGATKELASQAVMRCE